VIFARSFHSGWLSNAYLVGDREGGTAVVVDTGAPMEPLLDALRKHRLRLAAILCTHRHGDHTAGNAELVRETSAPILALREEAPHIAQAEPLADSEERSWGEVRVRIIALPGHTAGQCGYLIEGVGLFTGDCLFKGSLGGCVGPASSGFEDVRKSVERILALPDETPIHPGHTDPTTVGRERAENPFVRVLTGQAKEGIGRCLAIGRPAQLIVLARDYDGGTKAWVRFDDGALDAIVPGSRIEVETR
jgi:glyoxylase-like metal-dependent hydrolase (beta-lactamase superfamily II)